MAGVVSTVLPERFLDPPFDELGSNRWKDWCETDQIDNALSAASRAHSFFSLFALRVLAHHTLQPYEALTNDGSDVFPMMRQVAFKHRDGSARELRI